MQQETICGLDIGSSCIRALIAQPVDSFSKGKERAPLKFRERILGFSESPTKGFSKGIVSKLSLLSDAIEEAVSKAEKSARSSVTKLIVAISGVHIRTFKSRGSIHISDRPSEVTSEDIKRCIESAKYVAMSLDREVVHLVAEKFYIDDKIEISDPLGLFGSKLDVDLSIVTSLVSILQNITKAINLAGYEVEDMVASGIGTALAVFDHKELEEGSVLIDVGKDITEASLFLGGRLKDCFYFPFGSDDLTQALQDKLKIMFEKAEDLKLRYGIVIREEEGREISSILFPRVQEIMQDVYRKVEPFLKESRKVPHIRLVGGVSKMDGFIEAVEEIFSVPVSLGRVKDVEPIALESSFACCMGLARYGIQRREDKRSKTFSSGTNFVGRLIGKIHSLLSEYF